MTLGDPKAGEPVVTVVTDGPVKLVAEVGVAPSRALEPLEDRLPAPPAAADGPLRRPGRPRRPRGGRVPAAGGRRPRPRRAQRGRPVRPELRPLPRDRRQRRRDDQWATGPAGPPIWAGEVHARDHVHRHPVGRRPGLPDDPRHPRLGDAGVPRTCPTTRSGPSATTFAGWPTRPCTPSGSNCLPRTRTRTRRRSTSGRASSSPSATRCRCQRT